jgi:hypothetical protein
MKHNQGLKSKNVTRPKMRQGAPRQHVHPGGVAQQGQHVGNKAMNQKGTSYRGEPLFAGAGYRSELGNAVAARTECRPGGSRTVMKTGSQQVHGPVDPGQPLAHKGRDVMPIKPSKGERTCLRK